MVDKGVNFDIVQRQSFLKGDYMGGSAIRKIKRSDGVSHIDRAINYNNPVYVRRLFVNDPFCFFFVMIVLLGRS